MVYLLVSMQIRAKNRFALFRELLQPSSAASAHPFARVGRRRAIPALAGAGDDASSDIV